MARMTDVEKAKALAELAGRKRTAAQTPKIDNSSLYAGAAMYYYCRICGLLADVLPETHTDRPRAHCDPCQTLVNAGWSEKEQRFTGFRPKKCGPCGGSGIGFFYPYDLTVGRPRTCPHCKGKCYAKAPVT